MPSDRLTELQRQRALAQEQVAWFDREIARESGSAAIPAAPVTGTPVPAPSPSASLPDPSPLEADRIIKQYQGKTGSVRSEVRRGCLLYFAAAWVLLGLGLLAFWLIRRH